MTYEPELTEDVARKRLDNVPVGEALRLAHEALVKDLCAKAQAGTLTKEEQTVLRNILKDNGMTTGLPPTDAPEAPSKSGPRALPTFDEPSV